MACHPNWLYDFCNFLLGKVAITRECRTLVISVSADARTTDAAWSPGRECYVSICSVVNRGG